VRRSKATTRTLIARLTRSLDSLTRSGRPEQLVRARAQVLLRYLVDVPVAILVANNRARYVDVNRHAVALTGYTREELLRMRLADLTPNPNQAVGRRLWRAFLRRGRMAGKYTLRRKDGSTITTTYLAMANVLPGVHVSALVPHRRSAPSRSRAGAKTARRKRRVRA
jgi:PAS domain S-box-containing protein